MIPGNPRHLGNVSLGVVLQKVVTLLMCNLCCFCIDNLQVAMAFHGDNHGDHSDWMKTLPESLFCVPLNNLAIPGTDVYLFGSVVIK